MWVGQVAEVIRRNTRLKSQLGKHRTTRHTVQMLRCQPATLRRAHRRVICHCAAKNFFRRKARCISSPHRHGRIHHQCIFGRIIHRLFQRPYSCVVQILLVDEVVIIRRHNRLHLGHVRGTLQAQFLHAARLVQSLPTLVQLLDSQPQSAAIINRVRKSLHHRQRSLVLHPTHLMRTQLTVDRRRFSPVHKLSTVEQRQRGVCLIGIIKSGDIIICVRLRVDRPPVVKLPANPHPHRREEVGNGGAILRPIRIVLMPLGAHLEAIFCGVTHAVVHRPRLRLLGTCPDKRHAKPSA